jgi:hypothetical protein
MEGQGIRTRALKKPARRQSQALRHGMDAKEQKGRNHPLVPWTLIKRLGAPAGWRPDGWRSSRSGEGEGRSVNRRICPGQEWMPGVVQHSNSDMFGLRGSDGIAVTLA